MKCAVQIQQQNTLFATWAHFLLLLISFFPRNVNFSLLKLNILALKIFIDSLIMGKVTDTCPKSCGCSDTDSI